MTLALTSVSLLYWFQELPDGSIDRWYDTLKLIYDSALKLDSPAPYFILSVIGSISTVIEMFRNRYLYGSNRFLEQTIREEKQSHGATKRAYLESLHLSIKNLLCQSGCGFDSRCRLTIYRRRSNSDRELRRIFRHSPHQGYEAEGRIIVPIDEGVVGAAWRNHGEAEFPDEVPPENEEEFEERMKEYLCREGVRVPEGNLSMNSQYYLALAIDDHDTGRRVAIMVFEALEVGLLNKSEIVRILSNEALQISRIVKHLGALDREFNPDVE